MTQLTISLLGSVLFELDGIQKDLATRKAAALLAYLAVTDQSQRRDILATLFWPEFDTSRAKASLRRALADIKRGLGPDWLLVDRQMVQLNGAADIQIDVQNFRKLLADAELNRLDYVGAIKLYRGDFLAGFSLKNSLAFDEWQFFERESLRQEMALALETLVDLCQLDADFKTAVIYARRLVAFDPLHEPAQRQLIEVYAQSGQWTAAVRQFESCTHLLDEELGISPDPLTVDLFERLKTERNQKKISAAVSPKPTKPTPEQVSELEESRPMPQHNLPNAPTSFIGREKELTQILKMLADPHVRLLTIFGMGGIGKTRLALQAAHRLVDDQLEEYTGGVWFVDMLAADPANAEDSMAITIAQTVGLQLRGSAAPKDQLLSALNENNKPILLLLDNFEHLVESSQLISHLLSQSSLLRIVVTSREVLDLAEEWLFSVDGLPFPALPDPEEMFIKPETITNHGQFGAINLFVQRARQANHAFSFKEEQEQVVKITQMVEGLPLALELAAAWARMLTCEQIIDRIQQSLDFLSATQRNIPDRHLSIRAVFEASWDMMLPHEQDALAQMSIMRGGFTAEAAEAVADATIFTLNGLLNKSLLRAVGKNHFSLHELVRQFAADKFEQRYASSEPQLERLMSYYMSLLHSNEETLFGAEQADTLDLMEQEIENIYQAWIWAVKKGQVDALLEGFHSFYNYHSMRSKYMQGELVFSQTINLLQGKLNEPASETIASNSATLLTRLYVRRGEFLHIIGQLTVAEEVLNQGLILAKDKDLHKEQELVFQSLGVVHYLQGNYEQAKEFLNQALKLVTQSENLHEIAYSHMTLGAIELALGNLELAKGHEQKSLALYESLEYEWGIGNTLRFLSTIFFRKNQMEDAKDHAQRSMEIFEKLHTEAGMALALNNLGLIAHAMGLVKEARSYFMKSLNASQNSYHYVSQANSFQGLSYLANQLGEKDQEEEYLYQALKTAAKAESIPLILNIMLDFIPKLEEKGEFQKAQLIANSIQSHQVKNWEIRKKAGEMQRQLRNNNNVPKSLLEGEKSAILVNQLLEEMLEQRSNL